LEQEAQVADVQRKKQKRGNVLVVSILGLAVLGTIGLVGGGQLFKAYDRSHQIDETCEVQKAEASLGGSTSSRGAGALFDQVEVDTTDCGPLVLRRGVTEQNKQEIADELSSAGRVQFRIGAGSFKWRETLHTFRTPVIVQSYVAQD
jgi:Tfp pilus assembly protein PilX